LLKLGRILSSFIICNLLLFKIFLLHRRTPEGSNDRQREDNSCGETMLFGSPPVIPRGTANKKMPAPSLNSQLSSSYTSQDISSHRNFVMSISLYCIGLLALCSLYVLSIYLAKQFSV
jgi:hypothetical protein